MRFPYQSYVFGSLAHADYETRLEIVRGLLINHNMPFMICGAGFFQKGQMRKASPYFFLLRKSFVFVMLLPGL